MSSLRFRYLALATLVAAFPVACDDDDDGDTTAGSTSAADGGSQTASSTTASSTTASSSTSGAGSSSSTTGAGSGGGACVEAGGMCNPGDLCNSWTCRCMNSGTDFMTIGSCEDGTCSADGNAVCEGICTPNGGVDEAIDDGCG